MMRRWSFLGLALGLGCLAWWVGCTNPNLAGGKLHFDQATRLLDAGERRARFERARDTFRKASRELPGSGEARMWLGRTYGELGQPDSCVYWLAEAVRVDSTVKKDVQDTRDHYWSVMLNAGKTTAQAAEKAKSSDEPAQVDSLYRRAMGEFRQAAVYSPGKHDTYTNMAIVFYNLSQVDSAVVNFKKGLDLAPREAQPKIERLLFDIYLRQGEKHFNEGQEKLGATPSDSTGGRDSYLRAQMYYNEAVKLHPEDLDLSFRLGVTAYELCQLVPERHDEFLNEAITRYRNVLKEDPTQPDVLYNMALLLKEAGQFAEARDMAQRLVDVNPREATYRSILGSIERALGNKNALLANSYIGQALRSHETIDPSQVSGLIERASAGSDIRKRYLENREPEEIRTFQSSSGTEYQVWFYWTRGLAFGFAGGEEQFSSTFVPDGVLKVTGGTIADKGVSKVITGTVTNEGAHAYTYVRVEYNLFDENGDQIGWVFSSANKLDPKGKWDFEIPLKADEGKAARVDMVKTVGY